MTITNRTRPLIVTLAVLVALLLSLMPAAAAPWANRATFANAAFQIQWQRTDHEHVRANRTLYWGPSPWFDYYEFYRESPNGLRQVQYFDKARMEINKPSEAAVTNGLLVVEMVSGQQKLGDQPWDNQAFAAAEIPVAGDPLSVNLNSPTYQSFINVSTINDPTSHRNENRLGQSIGTTLDKGGNLGYSDELARAYANETKIVQYNTVLGHNIPAVFWNFLNQQGPIYANGQVQNGALVDWLSAMGYPIADPYWIKARVAGNTRDILVQLFERRVLTYTPANSGGYQVEMGNVGQHYFQWRYPHLGMPWAPAPVDIPAAFASTRNGHWEVFTFNPSVDNSGVTQLTSAEYESVAYSWRRTYGALQSYTLLGDSRRGDGTHRQLYAYSPDGTRMQRMTYTDGTQPPASFPNQNWGGETGNDYNAAASPDGSKVAFVSDRSGKIQIHLMYYGGGSQIQLTTGDCIHQTPSWSSDGRSLVWMANCDGDFEIYRGDLSYAEDRNHPNYPWMMASLVNVVRLTTNTTDDQFPRYSPDGSKIAFQSNRTGNFEIYTINASDGSGERRLTNNSGDDYAPSWSADGSRLIFSGKGDGDWEVYRINADGSGLTQLTKNTTDDHWVIWAQ